MADIVSSEVRSRMMRGIRSRNTKPERFVRSGLHRAGFRFRLNSQITGIKPDVVLPRWKAAIFVHGCFWHRHAGCRFAYEPKSRQAFWTQKFQQNLARDARQYEQLRKAGWRVFVVWECALRDPVAREKRMALVAKWIKSRAAHGEASVFPAARLVRGMD